MGRDRGRSPRNLARVCWGALLLASLALAGPAWSACQLTRVAEIPLAVAGSRPLINGQINGQKVALLADTGTTRSTVLRSAAIRMKLHEMQLQGMAFYGVGGPTTPTYVQLDELKLGDLPARNFSMLVTGEGRSDDAAALIGADLWAKWDDEIDLAHNVIRLIKPAGCTGDQIIYFWKGPYSVAKMLIPGTLGDQFIVPVNIDGVTLRAQLDTGSARSMITRQGFRTLGRPWPIGAGDDDQAHEISGLGKNRVPSMVVQFKAFTFDQETIANPKIMVADIFGADKVVRLGSLAPQDVARFPDMILGADFFLAHKVMISNSQRKVYIAFNGGKPPF
jgi:hypothetical protein